MAIIYRQGNNDDPGALVAPPTVVDDTDCDWWAGVQKCFASIALAGALATTALATQVARQVSQEKEEVDITEPALSAYISSAQQQVRLTGGRITVRYATTDFDDLPVTPPSNEQDEDYWQSGVAPVPAAFFRSPVLFDRDEIPAGSLFGQPDEDFWRSQVAPVAGSNLWPQQFSFDVQEPAGSLRGQPDEDFWQNPVQPVQPSMRFALPLGDQDDVYPTTPATLATDEDFWQNKVAPVQASLFRSPVFRDADEIPAGFLYGQSDEDFWANPVRPVQASFYQQLPYFFDSGDFARPNIVSEDFWRNPVAPVPPSIYRPQVFDSGDLAEAPVAGIAQPAGVELVAEVGTPLNAAAAQPGGSLPARRRRGGAFPSVPPRIQQSAPAFARPLGVELQLDLGRARGTGAGNAQVKTTRMLVCEVGQPEARGIRNPTDEELIAILMGA